MITGSIRPFALGATLVATLVAAAACASSSVPVGLSPSPSPFTGTAALTSGPSPDPRVGLKGGWFDAAEATWNLKVVSHTKPSKDFLNPSTPGDNRLTNSDLAFSGNLVFQGNYAGYQVWDISNPVKPVLRTSYVCPGSQSDVSVYGKLLFVSAEATSGRVDCGLGGVTDTVSKERARGIRIFDITDVAHPKAITMVQTCRGSHTNTLVTDPKDKSNVYIYVSGSAGVRSSTELAGCSSAIPDSDPNSALFRIEVIRVPLAHPEQAAIVSSPRIFENLTAVAKHAEPAADIAAAQARAAGRQGGAGRPAPNPALANRGPTQCHDITAYPAIGLAGGACGGYGLLLDISDVAHPVRIGAAADSNFSFWHSATFNNDGTKILFSDEWGGGGQPRCRVTDKLEWGADAIFTIENRKMNFKGYYKMPAPQTVNENCVAHNGTLIPIPGRDVMVQSFYQGGITIFDWSDPSHAKEIGFYDRGPMDETKPVGGGFWSSYWYNGYIVASEEQRGMDIFELTPSALLSQNEIDAAKSVQFEQLNAQEQPKLVWPATFALARAYVDQLVRNNGLNASRTTAINGELNRAEKMNGDARKQALAALATAIRNDVGGASDKARVQWLAGAVSDLASAK
jgi:hypothetical protein